MSSLLVMAQMRDVAWWRFEQFHWWHYLLLVLTVIAVLSYVVWWSIRDSHEQLPPVRWALLLLRVVALFGLLLYFGQLDKRTEISVTRNSRVAVLVDTSLSMTLPGTPSASGIASNRTRSEEAIQFVARSPLLEQLSQQHDVTVYRFDQQARPAQVAAIARPTKPSLAADSTSSDKLQLLTRARWLLFAAAGLGGLGLLLVCVSLGGQIVGARTWSAGAWSLLSGSLVLLIGMLSLAASILPVSDYPLRALLVDPSIAVAMDEPPGEEDNAMFPATGRTKAELGEEASGTQLPSDWQQALGPSGIETRLGDAIKAVLDREQGNPLAGIIVVTDGRNNAGLDPRSLILASQNLQVPLYFVGVGSDRSPANLKLVEVDAPKRIYPGDKFSLSTLLQASGFSGKTVDIQITAGPKSADPATYAIEAEQKVTINSDDELITTKFELAPKSVGEWVYIARVLATTDDAEAADNTQQTSVVVIERKNRVLIFAGGPTREYQFVRNLLFRDRDVDSHVLLQTGKTGISQEARQIIDTFPADRAALSRYDAVLAFDADWTKISDAQAQALEQWVAEQAGGLLMVAGTVEMPKWLARGTGGERSALLRSLSPVKLIQSGSRVLSTGRVESEKPWPLKLTTDGLQSDFMWLSDDPQTSARLWNEFEGVYSYNAAYELKPGARALALFNDPTAADDSNLPIYVASQFYGAGRVVYQGGGELWRLRELGDAYFDRYYTKLVRWISQGRLLLDSDRGILLADRDQALLGDQVTIRAVLKDERFQPLLQSEVVARLLDPQKRNLPLVLRPLDGGNQPGVYTAQFPIQLAGEYTVQLQLGGLASSEVLSTSIKARVPALEMQHAERHDELLRPLATQTGGRYFQGIDAALMPEANGAQVAIAASIIPQDRVSTLPGVPNLRFQLRWLGWLMALIAGSLTIEWFARRLHRLA